MAMEERKQSKLYTSRPVFLGNSIMQLYHTKKSINKETRESQLGSLILEMIEYTKPPHQRQRCFENPTLSIFGPNVDHSIDQEDLHNLDLTMSQTNAMRESIYDKKYDNEMFLEVLEEQDVVEIIKSRLGKIRKPYEPLELPEGPADVLIQYKTSCSSNKQMLLRAHSRVLSRHCNAFEELLESDMRDMTSREYLDRQFMRSRQFDENNASTEYEVEPTLAWCTLKHPEKPIVVPRIVTEAFFAFHEARKKALLPPPSEFPTCISDEQILQEKIDKGAFDIVKESHKLVEKLSSLELPPKIKEQFDKFTEIVGKCIPFTSEIDESIKDIKEEEEKVEKVPEPYQRTVCIRFSDYAPPGWEKLKERESIRNLHWNTLSKHDSQSSQVIEGDTLVKGNLIDGKAIRASEVESQLVGGELQEEKTPNPSFDANLIRGSLPRGSLKRRSEFRKSLLSGNLVGSEVEPLLEEGEPSIGKDDKELAEERVKEERTFFADFLATLPSTPEKDIEADIGPPQPPPTYILNKNQWTANGLHGVMEYLYTEKCHIPCNELPEVFQVANELLLTEVTEAITLMPLISYLRAALMNESNRVALLELCILADSIERPDLKTLKKFCQLFEYGSNLDLMPYTFSLHTGYIVGRKYEFLEEGFFEYDLVKVNILRIPEPGIKLFQKLAEQAKHFIISKPHPEWIGAKARIDVNRRYPRKFNMCENRNRDKGWFITIFNPKIADECYKFYKHIQNWTHKPMELEKFSIRMVMGFLVCPMMQTSISKSFPKEVKVEEVRGGGYFIGGEPHGNSLTLTGEPRHLLAAAKAIPSDLMGRTSLQIAFPSKKTFIKIFSIAQKFGVDFEMNCIYLLKNLPKIIRALSFFIDVSDATFIPWNVPREMIELVAPCDPF